jgi:hypothetical protein
MALARHLDDNALFDRVQEHTFRWFWDGADQATGMIPLQDSARPGLIGVGGTGFGVMALVVGAARGYVTRTAALGRTRLIVDALMRAERFNGVFPHLLDAGTGAAVPFTPLDDGGDLVETAYLIQGLLAARSFFDGSDAGEEDLRRCVDALWHAVEWDRHKAVDADVLLWHWSPRHGAAMNVPISGWNECLIAYVIAAASPTHSIDPALYHIGWVRTPTFLNGRSYYGIMLPLGPPFGGPLFFTHYSFLGLDPRGLRDRYADYWQQNQSHVRVNLAHCEANPRGCAGYGPDCWGLTACTAPDGYAAHAPDHDCCVIAPTAALASFPYAPQAAMRAMRHFHDKLGHRIWTDGGFVDAFCEERGWYSEDRLSVDQGPIVGMMENYRSGLLWRLFMQAPEVRVGLKRLGFSSPWFD